MSQPTTSTTINPALQVAPPEGNDIGLIDIDKINLHWAFVEGVQLTDLYGDGSRVLASMRGFGENAASNPIGHLAPQAVGRGLPLGPAAEVSEKDRSCYDG